MRIFTSISILLALGLTVIAQVDYTRTNWAFGKNSLVKFDENGPVAVGTQPVDATYGNACYSTKDGELLLSVGAYGIYNHKLDILSVLPFTCADAVIIPTIESRGLYKVFIVTTGGELRVFDINIINDVNVDSKLLLTNASQHITALKHCNDQDYWVIASNTENKFYSFLVKYLGISEPIVSQAGGNRTSTGDMRTSFDGKMLAVSNYNESWVEVFDIDPKCGEIKLKRRLKKLDPADDRPLGVCFAPDNKSLYVAWGYLNSRLAQYPIDDSTVIYNAFSYPENINSIEIALDGSMYIGVHENSILSNRIHELPNPNAIGGGSRVKLDAINTPLGTNIGWEFPNFIENTQGEGCPDEDIWDLLDNEYYICDLEAEATRLDAGKGFESYKWTPTGDTTQWIIVEKLGEYMVIVDAFNGCVIEDKTEVKRRCDLQYWVPNAFSPNGNNLNDVFKASGKSIVVQNMEVFNRWGQKIYEGAGWTGENAPTGVYYYSLEIEGFQDKLPFKKFVTGTVHLIR